MLELKDKPFSLTFDHVIHKSRGGTDAGWNLRPAHLICNMRRNTREGGLNEAELSLVRYLYRVDPLGQFDGCLTGTEEEKTIERFLMDNNLKYMPEDSSTLKHLYASRGYR